MCTLVSCRSLTSTGSDMTGWESTLVQAVRGAAADRQTLRVMGHGSKTHVLGKVEADAVLDTTSVRGIVSYQPEELVVTVRAGTPLAELNAALLERGQCLGFSPPMIEGRGTVGGALASGLSGPARPWWGAARDAVLGVTLINGMGELLSFGGQVMKNVAGYDVSRLQVGALGAFGVLARASLRVMPLPQADESYRSAMSAEDAVGAMRDWCGRPLPLAGLSYHDGCLVWRLAGHREAVRSAARSLGGQPIDSAFWTQVRDYALPELARRPLWRVACAPASEPAGEVLIDWAGAARFTTVRLQGRQSAPLGQPPALSSSSFELAGRIKTAFDPEQIFNPGVLRADTAA